ncbi:50S ribosomal protein L22 [Candidatus Peribacteria bacterium]|nr:50S ribosomal protein L22 [Candidatus Peribacteria bacterium]
MKAHAHSLRIAPKKANLIAKLVRGMVVADAMEALRKTHKKGARMVELLLRSAIANASHNDKQDAQTMVIRTIIVNQGTAYRRGMPMARGRQRPFRKFLSHIDLELGFAGDEKIEKSKKNKKIEKASPEAKSPVEDSGAKVTKKTKATSSSSSQSS